MSVCVAILTKNEECNIVHVIENSKKLTNNILIIDSGSTDKTVELAEKHGAKVVYRAWDNDFSAQRNFALEHIKTDWVLYLDADERMNDKLVEAIKKVLVDNKQVMYRFIRRNSAFCKDFKYGVLGPDYVVRLFPKDKVKWQDKVHERPVGDLPIATLDGYLKHYTYKDFDQYIAKMNQYSTIGAKNNFKKGKKHLCLRTLFLDRFLLLLRCMFLKEDF